MKTFLYDKSKIDWEHLLFPNKALWVLLVPLMVEQLLNSLMGMADTMMVSNISPAAISAVSLVDSINVLIIQVFSAMATGATILCSQYLGALEQKRSNEAARQVLLTVTTISVVLSLIFVLGRNPILRIIFGAIETDVMENAQIYLLLTAFSFPFIALFDVGAAFYRASGESSFPMKISVISNVMNIAGNAVLIFVCHWGVMGAALSTLVSRIFCAVVVLWFLRKPKQDIVIDHYLKIRPDFAMIGRVLAIGVPSGVENGMFQFGKLVISSSVSTLGTSAIAAQAMTNMMEGFTGIAAIGIGIGMMTVVGHCIGAGRKEEAKYYLVKLCVWAEIVIVLASILVFVLTKPITMLAGMEPQSARMCFEMMCAITIVKPLVWVFAFIPGYGMRAAGDVRFSMVVSTICMWCCRVVLCIFLIRKCDFGPIAVWIGMFLDWTVRGIIFSIRYASFRWIKTELTH